MGWFRNKLNRIFKYDKYNIPDCPLCGKQMVMTEWHIRNSKELHIQISHLLKSDSFKCKKFDLWSKTFSNIIINKNLQLDDEYKDKIKQKIINLYISWIENFD